MVKLNKTILGENAMEKRKLLLASVVGQVVILIILI